MTNTQRVAWILTILGIILAFVNSATAFSPWLFFFFIPFIWVSTSYAVDDVVGGFLLSSITTVVFAVLFGVVFEEKVKDSPRELVSENCVTVEDFYDAEQTVSYILNDEKKLFKFEDELEYTKVKLSHAQNQPCFEVVKNVKIERFDYDKNETTIECGVR